MARGFADLHNHQFANLGFGGAAFHGQAFLPISGGHPAGDLAAALPHCTSVHGPGGVLDVIGTMMRGHAPLITGHKVGGYPQFDGWPRWDSITHQAVYKDWLFRAVQGGLRLIVVLAVNNEKLAKSVEQRPMPTDDTSAVDRQIAAAKKFQDQIDNDSGGHGKGWYRIVYSPSEARSVIAQGKLAVVLGMEVDYPLQSSTGGYSESHLDAAIAKYFNAGIRHIFPIHFSDNAFGGTAFQNNLQVAIALPNEAGKFVGSVNPLNPLEVGVIDTAIHSYRVETEPAAEYEYRTGRRNLKGLSPLGKRLIRQMIRLGMMIDIDHMSARSKSDTFNICEAAKYPVVSGHTGFVTLCKGQKKHEGQLLDSEVMRLKALGGVLAAITNQGAVDEVAQFTPGGQKLAIRHDCGRTSSTFAQAYLFAAQMMNGGSVALGTDFNGFIGSIGGRYGSEACPGGRKAKTALGQGYTNPSKLNYPFTAAATNGTVMQKSVVGNKTFDFNEDGLAHVGLLPDLLADLEALGVTPADLDPLLNSAEGYVAAWERALASPDYGKPLPAPASLGSWSIRPGSANDIAIGADSTVWMVGTDKAPGGYRIHRWTGTGWSGIDAGLIRIAVAPDGTPWGINDAGKIFRRNGSGWDGIPGSAVDIAIGADSTVWVVGTDKAPGGYRIHKWTGTGWSGIDAGLIRIAVAPDGTPWGINDAGKIFRRNGSGWDGIPGSAVDIAIGADSTVWMVGTDKAPGGYRIHKWTGTGWSGVDAGVVAIAVGPKGLPWAVNDRHEIFERLQ